MQQLYIVMVGLPARGKSTVSRRLCEGLEGYGLRVKIFNNGEIRRMQLGVISSHPDFYHPDNIEGHKQREKISVLNLYEAKSFLERGGNVAILDATNSVRKRRKVLEKIIGNVPILYVECANDDEDMLNTSILRKSMLPEFSHLDTESALKWFHKRIQYYERSFDPLLEEEHYVKLDTLHNLILEEKSCSSIPHYVNIRDILVSDWVQHLYLVRHGESIYNSEGRIGGDSNLTPHGLEQSHALARHFRDIPTPFIFTSTKKRSKQYAEKLAAQQKNCIVNSLPEFDEIDAGTCEGLSYKEIKLLYPEEYAARKADKYNYVYPNGEGYCTLKDRVYRGLKKALFLAGAATGSMIIGHQALNRMILSSFHYRRTKDVPYISIPQNQYFHIVITHRKKLVELVRFTDIPE